MKRFSLTLCLLLLLTACAAPQAATGTLNIAIQRGDEQQELIVPAGSTVQDALELAQISTSTLDRIEPPAYTILADGTRIVITEITERFEIEQVVVPYESQSIRNEALPEGESRLLQPGSNGVQEITYRIVEEEGVEISRTPIKTIVIEPPIPEIIMIGSQSAYAAIPVEGMLVYAASGNAWLIQGNTSNRRPITVSGDLDGRVLEISPDGEWLLYTRVMPDDDINSLWIISLTQANPEPIPLGAENIVLFADWQPVDPVMFVAYSTSESSPSPPGWQANNDLILLRVYPDGRISRPSVLVEANSGGLYGWWGTNFAWAGNGSQLAYARADSIGLVDVNTGSTQELVSLTPYQTLSDWAWVSGISWGHDSRTLYFLDHGDPLGLESEDSSPVFNLSALRTTGNVLYSLVEQTGMFAYPVLSPLQEQANGELLSHLAYLQALTPLESDDSSYRLMVMDRDGSNRTLLFPPEGDAGLPPQTVHWSPDAGLIALMYRGDLWVVDVHSGQGQRLTGDGQLQNIDWHP